MYADDFDEKEKERIENKASEPKVTDRNEVEDTSKLYVNFCMYLMPAYISLNFFFFLKWTKMF